MTILKCKCYGMFYEGHEFCMNGWMDDDDDEDDDDMI
jgi:hypothetical protein